MNTRRNFLKSCGLFVLGCALAVKAELANVAAPASQPQSQLYGINPDWINAPYEGYDLIYGGDDIPFKAL